MQSFNLLLRIRAMLLFFMIVLALSGITAFPVYSELKWLLEKGYVPSGGLPGEWLERVWSGVKYAQEHHPFLFYGFDWLAFAHLVIAMLFIGPLKEPVKNRWVVEWGILACLSVIPLALIAGPLRGIPWYHILIDCSFGIIGLIPLFLVRSWILKLGRLSQETKSGPLQNKI